MRSGMRSWSKCVIFSRRMKSSSSAGPRSPALSEFWLSATGTPWLVVSTRPPESTRTRSSGPLPGLKLACGLPLPTFTDALVSVSVLPVTIGCGGSTVWPVAGWRPRPEFDGFAALKGNAAATASVPAILAVAASVIASGAALPRRPAHRGPCGRPGNRRGRTRPGRLLRCAPSGRRALSARHNSLPPYPSARWWIAHGVRPICSAPASSTTRAAKILAIPTPIGQRWRTLPGRKLRTHPSVVFWTVPVTGFVGSVGPKPWRGPCSLVRPS